MNSNYSTRKSGWKSEFRFIGVSLKLVCDETQYRKLSKDDELSILLSEFSAFVEFRFGKEHQEQSVKVTNAINDFQKIKQELGYGDIKNYEPEYIPDGFVENLLKAANQYVDNHK